MSSGVSAFTSAALLTASLTLIILVVSGSTGLLRTQGELRTFRLIGSTFARIAKHGWRLLGLSLLGGALYSISAITAFFAGRLASLLDLFIWAGLVFIGHRILLADTARQKGMDIGERGIGAVFLRGIVLGLIVFAILLLALTLGAGTSYILASVAPGSSYTEWLLGAATGIAAMVGSVYLARLSFVYPSTALGERRWFVTALQRSRSEGTALAAALWLIGALSLLFVLVLLAVASLTAAGTGMLNLVAANDPSASAMSSGITLFLGTQFVLMSLLSAYSLVSIACVSAAYDQVVLSKIETEGQRTEKTDMHTT